MKAGASSMMWIFGVFWAGAASAADVGAAEHIRLSGDMDQLASRQLWNGVERKFLELEKLGVDLTYQDLLNGAYAARGLGNMSSAYDRLRVAATLDGTREVIDWLSSIDTNYGPVELVCTPPRDAALSSAETPFDPDQRLAVEYASATVRKEGTFKGLLPRGEYTFSGHTFRVEPGIATRIDASPRLKKTTGIVISSQPVVPDGATPTP